MLTDEEKIQRAKEIYYRRNGISYRGEEKKIFTIKNVSYNNSNRSISICIRE